MKRLIIFLCLIMFGVANADFLGVKQASETISFFIKEPIDSLYGIPRLPDSVHIMTYADNASAATFQTRSTTYPFSDVSIDTLKIYGDTVYVFADQISDIDGAGGNFELAILVKMFTNGYYLETHHTVQVVSDSLENFLDASKDSSSSAAVLSKNNLDSLQSQDGWGAKEATLAYFDTLIYIGEHGLGIFIDSTAGNTNTVIGTDGTEKNPVSTLAAGRTLALALGSHRFYLHGGSTFNGAAVDLGADYSAWEFYGEGFGIELAFGGQQVTNSIFHNIKLSGAMHASGGDVLYEDCELGYITANFNGHAENCLLTDTIVVKAGKDIVFVDCDDGVTGINTPTIDLSGGASSIVIGNFTGGIRIMGGSNNDTATVTTDGQVIISANNTSLTIKVSGFATITDSGTTTILDKDAVFSRQEADLWVWANADTAQPDSSELGVWLINNLVGAAGSLDSTVLSNILHRIVWGTAVGSGSDSSTQAQRDVGAVDLDLATGTLSDAQIDDNIRVTAYSMANNVITNAAIATGAIGNDELADDIHFDSLSARTLTIINTLAYPALYVSGSGDNAVEFRSTFSGGHGLYAYAALGGDGARFQSASGSGHGLNLIASSGNALNAVSSSGNDIDGGIVGNITGDLSGSVGSVTGAVGSVAGNVDGSVASVTGNVDGSVKTVTDPVVAYDTVSTGDTLAVKKDSLIYQGGAASVTLAGIADTVWQHKIRADTTDGAVDDTTAADHLYSASLGGGGTWSESEKDSILAALFDKGSAVSGGAIPFVTRMILGFPGASPSWDSLSRTISSIIGDGYTGAAGSNIEDDFDTLFADPVFGGTGAYSCSLFAYNSGWIPNGGSPAITSGSVRMISGVNEYVLPINANGWVEFSLDGGTWTAYATALRFIQDTIPQTITFSTHHVDTLTMTAFSPSTPTDTGKVNLYVWTDRILGDTLVGATFRVIPLDKGKNWVTGGGRILPLGEVTKKTNSNGYAEIEVYQSSYVSPYPSGSDSLKYNISITYPGLSSWSQFRFVAPDSGNQYQIGVIE